VDELELADRLDERLGVSPEVAPEGEPEPAEGSSPQEGSPRARDEQGRFVAQPEEPEDPLVSDFLARHGGDANLALKTAAHQMSLMGQQAQELGELRKAVEGLHQDMTTETYEVDDNLMNWAQQAAVENPVEAAMWSLKNQPAVYDTIMTQWYTDDPMGASRFERSLEMQAYRQQLQAEIAPMVGPAQEVHQRDSFMRAFEDVRNEYPDMPQYANQMMEAARGAPEVMQALANGNAEAKGRVLRTLFFVARGQQLEGLTEAAQQTAQRTAADSRRLAAVGTMTSSGPPPPPQSGRTGQLDEWRRDFREAAGLPTDDLG